MSSHTKLADFDKALSAMPDGAYILPGWDVLSVRKALAAHDAEQAQEPVATVRVHKTGGNAGIAWTAVPTEDAPLLPDGTKLFTAPVEQAAKAVPAGFVLVPVAMTPEMRTALLDYAGPGYVDEECLPRVWSAILAAAPTPPAPEAQQPAGRASVDDWERGGLSHSG